MRPRFFARYLSLRWVQMREFEWQLELEDARVTVSRSSSDHKWYIHGHFKVGRFRVYVTDDKGQTKKQRAFDVAEDLLMNGIPNESAQAVAKKEVDDG